MLSNGICDHGILALRQRPLGEFLGFESEELHHPAFLALVHAGAGAHGVCFVLLPFVAAPPRSESPLSPGGLCCPVLSIYSGGVGCPGSFFCAAGSLLRPHGLRVWRRGFKISGEQRRCRPERAAPRTKKTAASPSTESTIPQYDAWQSTRADAAPMVNRVLAGEAPRAPGSGFQTQSALRPVTATARRTHVSWSAGQQIRPPSSSLTW